MTAQSHMLVHLLLITSRKNKEAKATVILMNYRLMDVYNMNFPFLFLHKIFNRKAIHVVSTVP
jgi:hypothetical protein